MEDHEGAAEMDRIIGELRSICKLIGYQSAVECAKNLASLEYLQATGGAVGRAMRRQVEDKSTRSFRSMQSTTESVGGDFSGTLKRYVSILGWACLVLAALLLVGVCFWDSLAKH